MTIQRRDLLCEQKAPLLAGWLLVIGSCVIMLGWFLQIEMIVSPFGAGVSRFNTGFMFAFVGLALINFHHEEHRAALGLQLFFILMVLLMASVTLLQYATGSRYGIDELFIQDWMPPEQYRYPGRPSPATALCFFAIALALLIRTISYLFKAFRQQAISIPVGKRSGLPHYTLALYASCILATATTVAIALLVWTTGSATSVLGRLSSGQSFLTSTLFLITCTGLLIPLLSVKPFEVKFYWLPQSTFVAFLVLGVVIAHNTHDNKVQYYLKEINSHTSLINQLANTELEYLAQKLSLSSPLFDDDLAISSQLDLSKLKTVLIEYDNGEINRLGLPTQLKLPVCRAPYEFSWAHNDILISVPLSDSASAASKARCVHGLVGFETFLIHPWQRLALKFESRFKQLAPQANEQQPTQGTERVGYEAYFTLADRQIEMTLLPSDAFETMFHQDSRVFLISLAAFFGAIAAIAVNMLLKSRKHYDEISKANKRLSILEARNRRVLEMAPEAVLLVNADGLIIYANRRSVEIFGYSLQELENKSVESLMDASLKVQHAQHRARYMQAPVTREMGQSTDLKALHADGHNFPVDIVLSPIEFDDERVTMAIIRDISDKISEKARIKQDLQEKEILLKEVYHRVKNNMQVIASLLRMQARTAEHVQTQTSLKEAALRISALALVHEKLYQSSDLSRASIKSYIESLVESLRQTYAGSGRLSVNINAVEEEFEPEVIVPIGLILNELISNAMKHAFSELNEQDSAEINVSFTSDTDNTFLLRVQDNGKGIPESLDIDKSKSLGLKLIKSLTAQLKAVIVIDSGPDGAVFSITIPNSALQPSASPMVTSGLTEKY